MKKLAYILFSLLFLISCDENATNINKISPFAKFSQIDSIFISSHWTATNDMYSDGFTFNKLTYSDSIKNVNNTLGAFSSSSGNNPYSSFFCYIYYNDDAIDSLVISYTFKKQMNWYSNESIYQVLKLIKPIYVLENNYLKISLTQSQAVKSLLYYKNYYYYYYLENKGSSAVTNSSNYEFSTNFAKDGVINVTIKLN